MDALDAIQEQIDAPPEDGYAIDIDRQRVDAYSPKLARTLDTYREQYSQLERLQEQTYTELDELAWALPGEMTDTIDDTFCFSLTRHPTRDRTVIYTPLHRFVERFDDAFQEETYSAFRERLDENASDSFETYFSIWDEKHEGWDETVWVWSRIADIDEISDGREQTYEAMTATEGDLRAQVEDLASRL
ncbi:MAG: hypothetical protein SV186_03190 [Candidatus Nanohaloarchaea archaeon]|nr:hypothetical protein [Candidatus Nanohaloarchaea archaeon]